MATMDRTPREAEARTRTERPLRWTPPALLPDPTPEAGYAFRWIRLSTLNTPDALNISTKLREGWEPVKASDHPELHTHGESSSRFANSVEIGGLLLCKTPVEFTQQRDAHYRQAATAQMESVDNNFMRGSDPRMPLFAERSTKVSAFGKGT